MTTKRILLIDIIRGFALIGILFANVPGIARMTFSEEPTNRLIWDVTNYFFEQRFFPIFSFLFGLGFFIFMRNAQNKGLSAYRLMIQRLVLLILFGLVHQFMQPGEALLGYGIFGFALLPLFGRSTKVILIPFLLFLVLGLYADAATTLAMFSLGFLLGKIGYFERLEEFRRPTQIVWLVSILLSGPLLWLQINRLSPTNFTILMNSAGLAIATAMTTSLILWSQTERLLRPLAAFGRMALTNYIMQSVIVLLIALAAGGFDVLQYRHIPYIWIAIWPIQIMLSQLWLRHYHFGPLEWLWRWGTYGKRPPFRKEFA